MKTRTKIILIVAAVAYCALIYAVSVTGFVVAAALGADKPPAFSNAQALSMLQAFRNLDGRQVVVKQQSGETLVMQPWDFGSGTLRLRIARNITALAAIEKTIDDARQNVIKELLRKGQIAAIVPGSTEHEEFQRQMNDILNDGAQVDLSRIKASEFRLDKNELPVTALSALAPILDDDVTPKP